MDWDDLAKNLTDVTISAFSENLEFHYFNEETKTTEQLRIEGVYDADYKTIDTQGNTVSSRNPMVEVSIRSLPKMPTKKDKVFARGVLYSIREIQSDATGSVKLYLTR